MEEQDVKALGGSGPKTLFTKQDYFVGAFKRKILRHSRPVRVKYLFSNQRRYSVGTRITDIMTCKMNRSINQSINQSLFKHGKIHQEFKN